MLNARAMGETRLKRLNLGFILVTPFALAVILIILFLIQSILVTLGGLVILPILWYAMAWRRQAALVKECYGTHYPRRPWPAALTLGLISTTALNAFGSFLLINLIVVIFAVLFATLKTPTRFYIFL